MRAALFLVCVACMACGSGPAPGLGAADARDAGDAAAEAAIAPGWERGCLGGEATLFFEDVMPPGVMDNIRRAGQRVEHIERSGGSIYLYSNTRFFPADRLVVTEGPTGTFHIQPTTVMNAEKTYGIGNVRFTLRSGGPLVLTGDRLRGESTWAFAGTGGRIGTLGMSVTGVMRWVVDETCPLTSNR